MRSSKISIKTQIRRVEHSMGKFNKGASTNLYYLISDWIFGGIAFLIALLFSGKIQFAISGGYVLIGGAFMVVYILSSKGARLYNVTTFFYVDRFFKRVTTSFLLATAITSTLLFYGSRDGEGQEFYFSFLACGYISLLCSAYLMHFLMKRRKKSALRTLLIGQIIRYKKFVHFLNKCNMQVNVVGYVSIEEEESEGYLGNISDLERIIHENAIDQIYIMQRHHNDTIDVQPYINLCVEMGVTVRVIMNSFRAGAAQSYVSSVGTYPVITYHTVSLNASSKAIKRMIDIIGASIGIIISAPIMLVTAIAIRMDSKGPIIFKQRRVGQNGRHFNMYKFRSMCVDAEEKKQALLEKNEMEGSFMFKIQDDPRITKVGKFIRKTSIDELPQFFNVLLGNMSLVGTRPPTIDEVEQYERNHWRRISIKPGITGLWQVSGRSEITDFNEIVELDTEYIDKWGVMMDVKIMLQTVFQVVMHRGAF